MNVLIKVVATGKILSAKYNAKMIGYETVDGFYNLGDAIPVK